MNTKPVTDRYNAFSNFDCRSFLLWGTGTDAARGMRTPVLGRDGGLRAIFNDLGPRFGFATRQPKLVARGG